MSSKLNRIPARVAFVDSAGLLTREALVFLEQLNMRVGGTTSPTIPEVSGAVNQAVEAAQAAQTAADEAAAAAQEAVDNTALAVTMPQAIGLTLEQVSVQVLALHQAVNSLSNELRRLRDVETYTLGG